MIPGNEYDSLHPPYDGGLAAKPFKGRVAPAPPGGLPGPSPSDPRFTPPGLPNAKQRRQGQMF